MDILSILLTGVITGISAFIGGYAMFKLAKNNMKEELFEFIGSEEGQKFIFGIGALIGNGAKAGIGLNKSGGKFGFKELAMSIAGRWLEKTGLLGSPGQQDQEAEVIEPGQPQLQHKRRSSW